MEEQTKSLEELRVNVAELCGWIAVKDDARIAHLRHTDPPSSLVGIAPVVQTMEHGKDETKDYNYWIVPDYPNDLNACTEFREHLKEEKLRVAFTDNLLTTCTGLSSWADVSHEDEFDMHEATAEQRCRAFVKTMEGRSDINEGKALSICNEYRQREI